MKEISGSDLRTTGRARAVLALFLILFAAACTPARAELPTQTPRVVVVTATNPIPVTGTETAGPDDPSPPPTDTTAPEATITVTLPPPPTEIAVIQADSQVRRLFSSVFAGPAQPLSELQNDSPLDLERGGLVSTNASGEAEILIQGCLKLFVFQETSLVRRTCRREDSASGLGICTTAGFTGVVNDCLAQVDIQTPTADVQTNGTWFSVIYLGPDQLTIVQTYEGSVDVNAVMDMNSGQMAGEQTMAPNSIWFSQPGQDPPSIGGISSRDVNDIDVWEAMRPELIDQYPILDVWMRSAETQAGQANLDFPDGLARPTGRAIMNTSGQFFFDQRVAEAFSTGVDWQQALDAAFSNNVDVSMLLDLPETDVEDARRSDYNLDRAASLLEEANYSGETVLIYAVEEFNDIYLFSLFAADYMEQMGLNVEVVGMTFDEFQKVIQDTQYTDSPIIWFTTEGEAFGSPN